MKTNNFLMQNKVFIWIAVGTLLLLIIPFSLMNFRIPLYDPGSGYEIINWGPEDFVAMGLLVFGTASIFILLARKFSKKYWFIIAIICLLGFFWLWVELAVSVFTNWGS